ncbi:XRE family transcriptional regulator [Alkaliphilus transvaalensis]|uniref:XRE family transcriptional regulator n=1 Tax=Alkaliphilus transvaalensis TaxID=114628 RepID=UPI00047BC6DB|nr:XRE family transcriptional regulator [Alkaliphilus transvaalensis]
MNRLALKIKEARQKAKMSEKELAKKCGLSVGYIIQVESGKKVINEKAAENILKVLGAKVEFLGEEAFGEEKTSKSKVEKPQAPKKEEFYTIQPTEQWADALANIIKKFPIYEVESNKIVGYKELPVLNKKIDGYHWDKILFVKSNNNELEALRIKKEDILMICRTNEIHNNSIYLLEVNQKRIIRQLRKEANNKVSLLTGAKGLEATVMDLNKIKLIGKCVKVEFEL